MMRSPTNERFNPQYVVSSDKKSPAIMIWGLISGSGRAGIHIMLQEKTINAETYLGILQEKLLMWIDLNQCDFLMQDCAP